jgi:hypothetical protein
MENEPFDSIARRLATGSDRRTAVKGLAAALAGLGIARVAAPAAAAEEVGTEDCGGKRDRCFANRDCCSGLKCKGGDRSTGAVGKCVFKNGHGGKGDWCKKDSDCDRKLQCSRRRCR